MKTGDAAGAAAITARAATRADDAWAAETVWAVAAAVAFVTGSIEPFGLIIEKELSEV